MFYEFSFTSLFIGIAIIIVGALMTVYYQKLANSFGSGVSSYDRFRLAGLITCGVGIIVMLSLHTIVLSALVNLIFHR